MRVGVIGVGSIGQHHVRVYTEMEGVELVGIADINKERVEELARFYKTRAYTSFQDLLDEKLDAASIAVPTTFHKEVALSAVQRGVSVLIEKPIADTIENAEEIIKVSRKNKVKLMIGHIERFNPAVARLKELISNGELGDVISISARRVGPYNPRIRDVGIIIDLATHDIDIMCYLLGERVKEVYALAGNVLHDYEDHAIIALKFGSGRSGVIETNWLTPHKVRRLTVVGSKGIAEVDYLEANLRIFTKEWIKEEKLEKEEPLKLELQHFIESVQQGKEPKVSGEDGNQVLKIAFAAMESYKAGKAISTQ